MIVSSNATCPFQTDNSNFIFSHISSKDSGVTPSDIMVSSNFAIYLRTNLLLYDLGALFPCVGETRMREVDAGIAALAKGTLSLCIGDTRTRGVDGGNAALNKSSIVNRLPIQCE